MLTGWVRAEANKKLLAIQKDITEVMSSVRAIVGSAVAKDVALMPQSILSRHNIAKHTTNFQSRCGATGSS